MSRSPNLREKFLDGEALFRRYYEMGESRSISLLTEWAIFQGMKSSTEQEPTPMGVWKAMWRWASMKENQHTAFRIVQEATTISFQEWRRDMIDVKIPSAWQFNTQAKLNRFLIHNGWV